MRVEIENPWFTGAAAVQTLVLEELLGTKLRALYQRQKGRDLYDIWLALTRHDVAADRVVDCLLAYLKAGEQGISCALFEKNLAGKLSSKTFLQDQGRFRGREHVRAGTAA
jgi:predicted nucleotidyltransferase component of viral defense system